MDKFKCLAIDMGASSIRLILGEISSDKINYEEIYRFKNEPKFIDNAYRWDIEEIVKNIIIGIKKALSENENISSIGVDTWGVDYVLMDHNDDLVEIPYAYRDSRTEGMMDLWKKDYMTAESTFKKTGINFYPFNTLFQLLASKDSDSLKKSKTFLFLPNYIYFLLTGIKFNELTISSTSQLLDVHSMELNDEVIQQINFKKELFAPVIKPGKIIGKVNHPDLKDHNVQATSVCSHDTASAVAAIPAESTDYIYLSAGTWCIIGMESTEPLLSNDALKMGFTNERGINNTYRILKNIVGLWIIQGIKKQLAADIDFPELEKMAQKEETPLLIDPEDELFYNPDNMIAAMDLYFEKTSQNRPGSIGEYIKCAYNSLSLSYTYHLDKLEEMTNKKFSSIHIIGGGTKSKMFCQSIADFINKPVHAGPVECTALGNIIVQGMAFNKIESIPEGRKLIKRSYPYKTYNSSIEIKTRDNQYQKFLKLKETTS